MKGQTMSDRKDFRQQTEDGLVACGKWLEKSAEDLSKTFAEGCQSWSVEFTWDCMSSAPCPDIHIMVDKIDRDIIEAYQS